MIKIDKKRKDDEEAKILLCVCVCFYIHNRSEEQIKKNIIFFSREILSLFIFWQFSVGFVVQQLAHAEELMVDHYSDHRTDISVFSRLVLKSNQ